MNSNSLLYRILFYIDWSATSVFISTENNVRYNQFTCNYTIDKENKVSHKNQNVNWSNKMCTKFLCAVAVVLPVDVMLNNIEPSTSHYHQGLPPDRMQVM